MNSKLTLYSTQSYTLNDELGKCKVYDNDRQNRQENCKVLHTVVGSCGKTHNTADHHRHRSHIDVTIYKQHGGIVVVVPACNESEYSLNSECGLKDINIIML